MSKLQDIKAKLELLTIPSSNSLVSFLPDIIDLIKGTGMMPPHLAAMGKGSGFDLAKGATLYDKVQGMRLKNTLEKISELEADLDSIDIDVDLSRTERESDFPYVKAKLAASKRICKNRLDTSSSLADRLG